MPTCWVLRIYDPRVCSCRRTAVFEDKDYREIEKGDTIILYIKKDIDNVEPLCYAKVSDIRIEDFFVTGATYIDFSG